MLKEISQYLSQTKAFFETNAKVGHQKIDPTVSGKISMRFEQMNGLVKQIESLRSISSNDELDFEDKERLEKENEELKREYIDLSLKINNKLDLVKDTTNLMEVFIEHLEK